MPLNPWVLLGILVALLGSFGTGEYHGHKLGINEQKIADQSAIDKVNAQITENKRIANAELADSQNAVIALQVERDANKTKLIQEHQKNAETTNKLSNVYAAYSLRFRTENAGCGSGSENSMPSTRNTSSNSGTTIVQLPDEITRNLRQLVKDADSLNDDYKLLYKFNHVLP